MADVIEQKAGQYGNKQLETVSATVTDTIESDQVDLAHSASSSWTPGFWPRFPWVGFGCLFGTVMLSAASVFVLAVSNHKGYSQWNQKIAPHIILSIFNGLATLCIAVAVANGATIAWWRQAVHGTTVKELQHTWSFSVSFLSVMAHLKHFNLAALAALAAKITIIDGVLFQRAATVVVLLTKHPTNLDITTYPTTEFPYTGFYNSNADGMRAFRPSWTNDLATWSSSPWGSVSFTYGFGECTSGACFVNATGIGFAASCIDEITHWDPLEAACNEAFTTRHWVNNESALFSTDFTLRAPTPDQNYTWIEMQIVTSSRDTPEKDSNQMCPVMLTTTTCELRPALINYPVSMQYIGMASTTQVNDVAQSYVAVSLGRLNTTSGEWMAPQNEDFNSSLQQVIGFDVEQYLDVVEHPVAYEGSHLGGIVLALQGRFGTRVSSNITTHFNFDNTSTVSRDASVSPSSDLSRYKAGSSDTSTWNPLQCNYSSWLNIDGSQIFGATSFDTSEPDKTPSGYYCALSFYDRLTEIMVDLNTLMFITSQDLGNRVEAQWDNTTLNQVYVDQSSRLVSGHMYLKEGHYETKWWFAGGAFAATIVCVLLVLPSYWGFWELGRPFTLSPIEIANAFQAPVLVQCQHEHGLNCAHASDVVKVAGREQVRYTACQQPDQAEPRFRFSQATTAV